MLNPATTRQEQVVAANIAGTPVLKTMTTERSTQETANLQLAAFARSEQEAIFEKMNSKPKEAKQIPKDKTDDEEKLHALRIKGIDHKNEKINSANEQLRKHGATSKTLSQKNKKQAEEQKNKFLNAESEEKETENDSMGSKDVRSNLGNMKNLPKKYPNQRYQSIHRYRPGGCDHDKPSARRTLETSTPGVEIFKSASLGQILKQKSPPCEQELTGMLGQKNPQKTVQHHKEMETEISSKRSMSTWYRSKLLDYMERQRICLRAYFREVANAKNVTEKRAKAYQFSNELAHYFQRDLDRLQEEREIEDLRDGKKIKRTKYGEVQRNHMSLTHCSTCNHAFCKRAVEHVRYQNKRDQWAPIVCGLDITRAGRIYCCQCWNRHREPTPPLLASIAQLMQRNGYEMWDESPDSMDESTDSIATMETEQQIRNDTPPPSPNRMISA